MASNIDFIEFICSQIKGIGTVRYRKMFGDYMIYLNEKPIILVCDNIAYVKKHPSIANLMQDCEIGIPYNGAKEHYILDVEHRHTLVDAISTLEKVLPFPKEKKVNNKDSLKNIHPFRKLPNVGPRTEQNLLAMGYTTIESLKVKKQTIYTWKSAVYLVTL